MTLLRRRGGDDPGWHLAIPAEGGGRGRITLRLAAGRPGHVPAALADIVTALRRERPLVPVATSHTRRQPTVLLGSAGEPVVVLVDDTVSVTGAALGPLVDQARGDGVGQVRALRLGRCDSAVSGGSAKVAEPADDGSRLPTGRRSRCCRCPGWSSGPGRCSPRASGGSGRTAPPRPGQRDRKKAKRARYATEFAAPILKGDARAFAKVMPRITDVLGDMHDAQVAQEALVDLPKSARLDATTGFALGLAAREQRDAELRLQAAFRSTWPKAVTAHRRWRH